MQIVTRVSYEEAVQLQIEMQADGVDPVELEGVVVLIGGHPRWGQIVLCLNQLGGSFMVRAYAGA